MFVNSCDLFYVNKIAKISHFETYYVGDEQIAHSRSMHLLADTLLFSLTRSKCVVSVTLDMFEITQTFSKICNNARCPLFSPAYFVLFL